jgi:cytoskeletal protein CcmA (bactofilin family)
MTGFDAGTSGATKGFERHATMGPTLSLVGDIYTEQDLLVRGTITGNLDMPDHALTIAPGGRVVGRVFARAVTIDGVFEGNLTATARVQVFAGATVRGDVCTPRLFVEDGALVEGKIDTRRTDAAMRVARYRLEKRMALK